MQYVCTAQFSSAEFPSLFTTIIFINVILHLTKSKTKKEEKRKNEKKQ